MDLAGFGFWVWVWVWWFGSAPDFWTAPLPKKSVGCGGFAFDGFGGGIPAEGEKHRGGDAEAEERAGDEAADDDDGHGMEDFLSRLIRREHERNEADARGQPI